MWTRWSPFSVPDLCVLCPAVRYMESDPAGRDTGTPTVMVKQGSEPPTFTGWFLGWNPEYWTTE